MDWSDSKRYSGSYPYLPKKITTVLFAVAILLSVGIVNGLLDPPPPTLPTSDQIEGMSCLELNDFLKKNVGNHEAGMSYWVEVAALKFLDECSSYK